MQKPSINKNLYELNISSRYNYSCIVNVNSLSPNKLYFTKETNINIPKLIFLDCDEMKLKKQCHSHIDFDNNLFLYFLKFDIDSKYKYAIPVFKCKKFICLSCNKNFDPKSDQCCSLMNSPLQIIECTIEKLILSTEFDYEISLKKSYDCFIQLHFPDLLDKIMLR